MGFPAAGWSDMKRWLKWLLLGVAALLVGLMILAAFGYRSLHQSPEFYRTFAWDSGTPILSQRVLDQVFQARSMAQASHYREVREARGTARPTTAMAPPAAEFVTLNVTEEELNAFLLHNSAAFQDFRSLAERYVSGMGFFLRDHRLIAAARISDLNCVVSFHFEPSIDDRGRLRLKLTKVLGGRLPLPQFLLAGQLDLLRQKLGSHMPQWQTAARIGPTGASNMSAMKVSVTRLVLDSLENQPTDAVLFMPVDEKLGDRGNSVPLRITSIDIGDQCLSMTLRPMTRAERQELLARLVQPEGRGHP